VSRTADRRQTSVVISWSVRQQSGQTTGNRSTHRTHFCFAAQRSSSKAVHGQASDNRRQSVFSRSAAGHGVSHTATDVRRSSSVGLRVSGPGRRQGTARHTAHIFVLQLVEWRTSPDRRQTSASTDNWTNTQLVGDPETRRPQVKDATVRVFWTWSTQLGSAHGETTGQQHQSSVAGRTLQ